MTPDLSNSGGSSEGDLADEVAAGQRCSHGRGRASAGSHHIKNPWGNSGHMGELRRGGMIRETFLILFLSPLPEPGQRKASPPMA